jgi:peptide/nickel transport system permease protein
VALAVVMGIPLGIVAARKANTWLDLLVSSSALMGVVTPVFVTGTLLVLLLSIEFSVLPSSGWVSPTTNAGGHFKRVLMPVVVLAFSMAAVIMRMTRSSMLEVIRQDYIRTARAKGLAEAAVLYGHALKNSLIPVVTVVGVQMGNLLGGMVIVEQVFAWPGVSTFLIDGITKRDYPAVQAVVLVICVTFVVINLVVDLAYGYLDPRIKYQ